MLGETLSDDVVSDVRAVLGSVPPRLLSQRLRLLLETDSSSFLRDVDVPIAYLRATRDRLAV